jgi:hypothetical protein
MHQKPPFLGSWKRVYIALLLFELFLVLVFYALTYYYNHS